jgi:hypothetical protein
VVPALTKITPVHTTPSYLSKIHFNIMYKTVPDKNMLSIWNVQKHIQPQAISLNKRLFCNKDIYSWRWHCGCRRVSGKQLTWMCCNWQILNINFTGRIMALSTDTLPRSMFHCGVAPVVTKEFLPNC